MNIKTRSVIFEKQNQNGNLDINSDTVVVNGNVTEDAGKSKVTIGSIIRSRMAKLQKKILKKSTGEGNEKKEKSIDETDDGNDESDVNTTDTNDTNDTNDDNDENFIKMLNLSQPKHLNGCYEDINDLRSRFENGKITSKKERREEQKQEIQNIRSRLFMGKQARIKEMYQQAVAESNSKYCHCLILFPLSMSSCP